MLALGSLVSRLRAITAGSLIVICVLIFQLYGQSIAYARVIPEAEAVHLLRMYLRSQGYDTKDFPLDVESNPGDNSAKGFYLYYVNVATRQGDFVSVLGAYGVNAETGDIWERVGCKRLKSSAIASLQRQIRDASGLSATELERSRNMNPCYL
jgi:hypothetical protein